MLLASLLSSPPPSLASLSLWLLVLLPPSLHLLSSLRFSRFLDQFLSQLSLTFPQLSLSPQSSLLSVSLLTLFLPSLLPFLLPFQLLFRFLLFLSFLLSLFFL